MQEQVKSCANCAYCEMTTLDFPCNVCMDTGCREHWTPKKEKTLVGDITTGYRYVDTDIALIQASTTGLPMAQYVLEALKVAQEKDIINKQFGIEIRKENTMPPKMNYGDLYINGNLFGGLSEKKPTIKDIEILAGVTTLIWSDGDVTMVTQGPDDEFDAEKAIAMAIAKKFMGTNKSKSNYIEEIRRLENRAMDKFVKRMEKAAKKEAKKKASEFDGCMNPPVESEIIDIPIKDFAEEVGVAVEPEVIDIPIKDFAEKVGVTVETIRRQCIRGQYPGAKKVDGKWYIPVKKEE